MDSEMKWLYIGIIIWGILMALLLYWVIKTTLKTYLGKIWRKQTIRTQPLTSATLSVGDALLFKEKWKFPFELEPSVVNVYYEVQERKPSTIVFVRKDNEVRELSYQQVDQLIAKGVIVDF